MPLLHASALVWHGHAFALAAAGGFGKSTLAAALARRGAALLSDDTVPLQRDGVGFLALPYLPRIKLWGDSLEAFGAEEDAFEPVLSWASKRRVRVEEAWGRAASDPAPLAAIYFLGPHRDPARAPSCVALEPVEATLALQGGMYLSDLQTDSFAAEGLRTAAAIAAAVPVRRISYFRSFATLPAVCEALLADVADLEAAS